MAAFMGHKPLQGRYYDDDWQREHSDVVRCPDCFGPVQYKEWEDGKGRIIATHYRCEPCRTNWWAE